MLEDHNILLEHIQGLKARTREPTQGHARTKMTTTHTRTSLLGREEGEEREGREGQMGVETGAVVRMALGAVGGGRAGHGGGGPT